MNSCILMAQIVQAPQLRYTTDNTPIAEMLVEFPGFKADDPPATLKVVGWGELATRISEEYQEGDHIVIEGRLNMNTVERPEGFKEKRAELTVSRIHSLESLANTPSRPLVNTAVNSNVVPLGSRKPAATAKSTPAPTTSRYSSGTTDEYTSMPEAAKPSTPETVAAPVSAGEDDEIPF